MDKRAVSDFNIDLLKLIDQHSQLWKGRSSPALLLNADLLATSRFWESGIRSTVL